MPSEPTLTFRGDQTATFDPATGGGTVGKVVGRPGRWLRITSSTYDVESDRTRCTFERLEDPNVALTRHLSEEWHA